MFEHKLAQPRKKKRPRYTKRRRNEYGNESAANSPVLQQPFPIPISSLTGIEANNSVWRWYRGKLKKRNKVSSRHITSNEESSPEKSIGIQDDMNSYYFVEITPDNEAHSILSRMGFFGETEENLVTYRNTTKSEVKLDTYVSLEEFVPKINIKVEDKFIKNDSSKERESENVESKDLPTYLRLDLWEAFFLSYGLGCLLVSDSDNFDEEMSIDNMWVKFCQVSDYFPIKYAVYHHFRSKGWVVKDGCKFGADFLLYKDGPPFYHASYSVWIRRLTANTDNICTKKLPDLDWTSLSGLNRVTESASKEILIVDISEPDNLTDKTTTVSEYLKNIKLEELLVRRWVASSEKQDVD